jgi:WD40 repeat protein
MVHEPGINRPPWLVGIAEPEGRIVGVGFLLQSRQVITCAHVVNRALGLQIEQRKRPDVPVILTFPFLPSHRSLRARVSKDGWWPAQGYSGDVAVLDIQDALPANAQPAALAMAVTRDHEFAVFGFPATMPMGVWSEGRFVGHVSGDWYQLEGLHAVGRGIESGFSGGPVWDNRLNAVVGLVVGADLNPGAKTAFMIPVPAVVQHWPRLHESIRSDRSELGSLNNVPPLPPNFVSRQHDFLMIKRALLEYEERAAGQSSARLIGMTGMGGIGKSVLAAVLCRDDDVRSAFPDGVLWIELGPTPLLVERQSQVLATLGVVTSFSDVQSGRAQLDTLLRDKACLLVLDNVWRPDHLAAFDVLSEKSALLFTTRDSSIVSGSGAFEYEVGLLSTEESIQLLAGWSGEDRTSLPPQASVVISECHGLALALAISGAMVRNRSRRWDYVANRLKASDLGHLTASFPHYPHSTVLAAIELSVEELDTRDRKAYGDLAVFKGNGPVPMDAVIQLWETRDIPSEESEYLIETLASRSLARLGDDGRLMLHDLQMDYAAVLAADVLEIHERLLSSYRKDCLTGWPSGPDDGYFFQYLPRHLLAVGRPDEMKKLLLDPRWIIKKIEVVGVAALAGDYGLVADDCLDTVQKALLLSARAIVSDSSQVASQLTGRLADDERPDVAALIQNVTAQSDRPWVRPMTRSLHSPSGGLTRTLNLATRLSGPLAITPDGRFVVCASSDATLRRWDLMRGSNDRTLAAPEVDLARAPYVWISGNGEEVVALGPDGSVTIWNLSIIGHPITSIGRLYIEPSLHMSMAMRQDDTALVTSGAAIALVNVRSGQTIWKTIGSAPASAIDVHVEGSIGVVGRLDGKLMRIYPESGQCDYLADAGFPVALVNVGRSVVAVGSSRGEVAIFDLDRGVPLSRFRACRRLRSLAISSSEAEVVCVEDDGPPSVWFVAGRKKGNLYGHGSGLTGISVARSAPVAVSTSGDGTLRVWNLKSSGRVGREVGHAERVTHISVLPRTLQAISASEDGSIKRWLLDVASEGESFRDGHRSGQSIVACALTGGGLTLVSGSDAFLETWRIDAGLPAGISQIIREGASKPPRVIDLTGFARGNLIIAALDDGTLRLFDVLSAEHEGGLRPLAINRIVRGELLCRERARLRLSGNSGIACICPMGNRDCVACARSNGQVQLVHLDRSKVGWEEHGVLTPGITVAEAGKTVVTSLSSDLAGDILAVGMHDGTVCVYGPSVFAPAMSYKHEAPVTKVVVSPDGELILSATAEGALWIWLVPSKEKLCGFTADVGLTACGLAPLKVPTVVCGDAAGTIHFLEILNLKRAASIE